MREIGLFPEFSLFSGKAKPALDIAAAGNHHLLVIGFIMEKKSLEIGAAVEWVRAIVMVIMGLPVLLLGIGAALTGIKEGKPKTLIEGAVFLVLGGILVYAGLTGTPLGSVHEDIPMRKM